MKHFLFSAFIVFLLVPGFSQVTYIGITNHNVGTGSNNLFNNYVAVAQHCYIDWEVYSDGMTEMEACGFRSVSRLVLRRTATNDSTSVVAAAPIVVPGICGGKNGNNDRYYADLAAYIDRPGRYSVEIQADLPNMTFPFENNSTKTTCNYFCPSAYYLTGTGGPTGNYYTPSGSCAGGPGLSDPVGGRGTDMLKEIFPALKFFTVGEAGVYRDMVVLNGNFYDMPTGKFQPGNPALPATLNGTNGIPLYGICPVVAAPQLSLGGEINNFKRTDCSADVTGANIRYRLYKEGTLPGAFTAVPLAFGDDCPFSPNGPEGNTFPTGGSCQNANNILDQRWKTVNGAASILPASFALSDSGNWRLQFFTETFIKDCAGISFTRYSDTATTTFTVNNPLASNSPCAYVIPIKLSSFTVTPFEEHNLLRWTVEEAAGITSFTVEISFNGYSFISVGSVLYNNINSLHFTDNRYANKTVFYRLKIHEANGAIQYSPVVRVSNKKGGTKLTAQVNGQRLLLQCEQLVTGRYHLYIINTTGSLLMKSPLIITGNASSNTSLLLTVPLSAGIYYAVVRSDRGEVVAKAAFRK